MPADKKVADKVSVCFIDETQKFDDSLYPQELSKTAMKEYDFMSILEDINTSELEADLYHAYVALQHSFYILLICLPLVVPAILLAFPLVFYRARAKNKITAEWWNAVRNYIDITNRENGWIKKGVQLKLAEDRKKRRGVDAVFPGAAWKLDFIYRTDIEELDENAGDKLPDLTFIGFGTTMADKRATRTMESSQPRSSRMYDPIQSTIVVESSDNASKE